MLIDSSAHDYLDDVATPFQLQKKIDFSLTANGNKDLLPFIDQYFHHSAKTGSKQFCNQLYGGNNIPAIIGEIITAVTNTSMCTYEVAPMATIIEKEMIRFFL